LLGRPFWPKVNHNQMKVLVFLSLFFVNNVSLAQESFDFWESKDFNLDWPSSINESDSFYRGQATNLTTFTQLLEMLTVPEDNSLVTSRLLRSLKKIHSDKSLRELVSLVDKQIDWWREKKLIWKITDCHVDVYGCSMPDVEDLMGVIFTKENLPEKIKEVLKRQKAGGVRYLSISEMSEVLEFFDPIVSTSYYKKVADKFAKDKDGGIGYTLILNDKNHRNCKKEFKLKADCFINHEEYLEEFEMPYWGYVLPEELNGFFVDDLGIKRKSTTSLIISQGINSKTIELGSEKSCLLIQSFDFSSKRKQVLFTRLNLFLNCKK